MEVDPEDLKQIVRLLIGFARRVQAEMLAQASALSLFAQSDPSFDMKRLLETARKNPKIGEVLDRKYGVFEREVIENIEKQSLDQAFARLLREWKPEGPTN